jgi:hypothetical protein
VATPFLLTFSAHLVDALADRRMVELAPGAEADVAAFVATRLAEAGQRSLLSALSRALLEADGVIEVFASDDELKELIQDLPPVAARGR